MHRVRRRPNRRVQSFLAREPSRSGRRCAGRPAEAGIQIPDLTEPAEAAPSIHQPSVQQTPAPCPAARALQRRGLFTLNRRDQDHAWTTVDRPRASTRVQSGVKTAGECLVSGSQASSGEQ